MAWGAGAFNLLRKLDKLLTVEARHSRAIEALQDKVAKLEQERELLIVEMRSAAAQAASAAASQHIADISRRLGALEERLRPDPSPPPRRRRISSG